MFQTDKNITILYIQRNIFMFYIFKSKTLSIIYNLIGHIFTPFTLLIP